jgi:SAM-dependent methyltransferase
MPHSPAKLAVGTNSSVVVDRCQICESSDLKSVLFLGYLPPVNTLPPIGTKPTEQPAYPAEMVACSRCGLVQLGLVVDPAILFPPSYPYTSGTTRILRDNFAELATEVAKLYPLKAGDLVVDVGSNDGTLLQNFNRDGVRVFGIEPTNAGKLARDAGIPTLMSFFNASAVATTIRDHGKAQIITAANVFAHIEDVHAVVEGILSLLADDGLFISESHYLLSLVQTLQYDTIYHEHLRYYSLTALKYLLAEHDLEVIHARRIPTHGGSIRVYAARKGKKKVSDAVATMLEEERHGLSSEAFADFRRGVVSSKLGLLSLIKGIKEKNQRIFGIGAPARASTLVTYTGLTHDILDCILEVKGSHKIGKYMPGSLIPVLDESTLFEEQPEYVLLLSWHIADELAPKLRNRGFKGKFIVPLPVPRILDV